MGRRREPKTLNDRMLAEGPREADSGRLDPEHAEPPDHRSSIVLWLVALLVLLSLKAAVPFLPTFIQLIVGAIVVTHLVRLFLASTRPVVPRSAPVLRVLMYLWLAFSVVVTIPIVTGGFKMEDRAPLGFVWPMFALFWMAYRIRASRHARAARKLADAP